MLPVLSGTSSMTPYAMYSQSDLRVADTDLIRCRQISLTYSVGESILRALHLKYASISWSMSNPFMIAFDKAWKGLDPETKDWPARADDVSFFERDLLTSETDKRYENERKNFIDNMCVGNLDGVLF